MSDQPEVFAADIPWRSGTPSPWPLVRPIITVAARHLRAVADADTAAVVEHLLHAVVDRHEHVEALREALSKALAELREATRDRDHIRTKYHALLNARREAA